MEILRPLSGVLISIEPGAHAPFRRRLVLGQDTVGAIERAVRITQLSCSECLILDCEELPAETAQAWLKLPGRESIRVVVTPASEGALACAFVQPLYPSELKALLAYRPQVQQSRRPRPRCTLL
jgi:hypothetical protein